MELIRKLSILADAAKYDASCASSGAPDSARRRTAGLGLHHRHGHLPQLHARRPLHLAAQDPADQLLPLRLQLLRQPPLERHAARALHARRGRASSRSTSTGATTSRACSCRSGIIRDARLHDGAARRGRAHAARGSRLPRLHPPQDDSRRRRRADRARRAARPIGCQREHRAADRRGAGDARAGKVDAHDQARDGPHSHAARRGSAGRAARAARSRPPARARR